MPPDELRLIGVAVADVSDWRDPAPHGKWSQLFGSLAQVTPLEYVIDAEAGTLERYLNLATNVRPSKRAWWASAGVSPRLVRARTRRAQAGLDRHEGRYDAILQLQTRCAPGTDRHGAPYAIYTDNTMALTRRHYPAWAPVSERRARAWMAFEADVCRGAEAVFTCSEFTRESVLADYGCRPEQVIAVGAGANQYLESLAERAEDRPRALFVGMEFERKGGPDLLRAWPQVTARVPGAELLIVGPTSPAPALPPGVRWLGRLDRPELARVYATATLFVLPSRFEPWGFVFFEAMGHGLPCVATNICAMPEMVTDGVTGRLVPPRDPEALAGALGDLLGDLPAAAAMGRAAHRSVLEGNRWADVAHRILAGLAGRASGAGAR